VWKVIDDGPDGELALHMKGGLKFASREQESVDAPQALRFDFDEETGAAFTASEAGIALEFPRRWIAADDLDHVCGVDGFRRIGAAVDCLTVVAMTVELDDRLSGDFDLDRSAPALDLYHSFGSGSFLQAAASKTFARAVFRIGAR